MLNGPEKGLVLLCPIWISEIRISPFLAKITCLASSSRPVEDFISKVERGVDGRMAF